MKKVASVLLGSGFSVPDGLPTVAKINERMKYISEEEVFVHSDMHAMFLNGQVDNNRSTNQDERLFIQEFLHFYNEKVLKGKEFHYETFYDFYALYLKEGKNNGLIEPFCKSFDEEHVSPGWRLNALNRVSKFNKSFNQLLASLLHRPNYIQDIGLLGYGKYGGFLGYLRDLLETHDVKVHTLNHDMLFEHIGRNHTDFFDRFADGFELIGSPFYGRLSKTIRIDDEYFNKTYRVKVPYYTGRYNKSLSLYKLHGSIQNYIVYTQDQKVFRIKPGYGVDMFYMEKQDQNTGEWTEVGVHDEVDPDFLSGTTNKILHYEADPFYRNLFESFRDNLQRSDTLIVIGYGFRDPGINEYLEKNYLNTGKKMMVIDPGQPDMELIEKYQAVHHKVDVAKPYEFYKTLLPGVQKA